MRDSERKTKLFRQQCIISTEMVTPNLVNETEIKMKTSPGYTARIVFIAIFASALAVGSVHGEQGDLVAWMKYDQALAKAKKENKHVIVNFTTSWCGWCKKMKASTYSNPQVVKVLAENFVAAKVDGDSYDVLKLADGDKTEKGLTLEYGVRGYPTTWFLEPNGNKIAPAPGFVDSTAMQAILDYVGNNYNDEMAFTDYLTLQKKLESLRAGAKLKLGMTTSEVKSSWGNPEKVEKKTEAFGPTEEWQYAGNQFLIFRDGKLHGLQERGATANTGKEKAVKP